MDHETIGCASHANAGGETPPALTKNDKTKNSTKLFGSISTPAQCLTGVVHKQETHHRPECPDSFQPLWSIQAVNAGSSQG